VNRRNGAVFLRIVLILVAVIGNFALFQHAARTWETGTAVRLLHALGARNLYQTDGASIVVSPHHRAVFRAVVTPSCSALASVLTIACLALLAPGYPRRKRLLAFLAACLTVVLGNILRIAGSIGMGLVWGRSSLVLFHDAVGSVFGLAYTLAGYLIMLHVLLPKRPRKAGFETEMYGFEAPQPASRRPLPGFIAG
jgi:exosortase/archaeosortase family protein